MRLEIYFNVIRMIVKIVKLLGYYEKKFLVKLYVDVYIY